MHRKKRALRFAAPSWVLIALHDGAIDPIHLISFVAEELNAVPALLPIFVNTSATPTPMTSAISLSIWLRCLLGSVQTLTTQVVGDLLDKALEFAIIKIERALRQAVSPDS